MEFPRWLFITMMVFAVALVLALAGVADILLGKPNLLITALSPIIIVAFFVGLFWLASRDRLLRRRRLSQVSTASKLWALTHDEMEDVATELFRLQGYSVTENKRPDLADGGVDFEVVKQDRTWLVQVKHWRDEVGVTYARELWGLVASEGATGGILIGTSGFSGAAREFAEAKDLRLIDGPEFMKLRSQLPEMPAAATGDADPLISDDFARYFGTVHRPACPRCATPMVLITRLDDLAIAKQFWGCKSYPDCQGTRRFVPFLPIEQRSSSRDPNAGG